MGNNRLAIAAGVLLVIAGLLAWKLSARISDDGDLSAVMVKLPTIDKAAIDSLEVSIPGKPTVLLTKKGDTWQMTQPLVSSIEPSMVEGALSRLAEIEVAGVAATRKENHERLEVGETAGIRVIAKQGDKVLGDLVIGKYANGNTMVREHSSDRVASVRGSIRYAFAKEVKDWRNHSVLSFDGSAAKDITFVSDQGTFKFVHEAGAWTQAPGEPAIAEFDGAKVQSLTSALSGLIANGFAEPTVTPEQAGVEPALATVTVNLGGDAGDKQVVLRLGNAVDDNVYIQAEGNPVIFALSNSQASRFKPDAAAFKKDPPPDPSAAPQQQQQQPTIEGLPPGVQLPPDIMRQLQQQAQQQAQQRGQ